MVKFFFNCKRDSRITSKFSNDLKNVSRHCGGHYNIKIRHFEDFTGGGAVPAPPHVK